MNCSSYVQVSDPAMLESKLMFSQAETDNSEFILSPVNYQIYMEIQSINFQDISEAKAAAAMTE